MLLYHDTKQPLYIVGTTVSAAELVAVISQHSGVVANMIAPDELESLPAGSYCMLGFWNIEFRKKFLTTKNCYNYQWPSFIHPMAVVSNTNDVGPGCVIHPMSVVGYNTKIGSFCIVGPHSHIGYNTTLGINTVVCPGSIITGSVKVGSNVFVGQSSSIKDKVSIADNVTLAMSSVVTKDINTPGQYYHNRLLR